jgi:hypothetical protein
MGAEGPESSPDSPRETQELQTDGVESGAFLAKLPPALAKIISAWPRLNDEQRRAMLKLID